MCISGSVACAQSLSLLAQIFLRQQENIVMRLFRPGLGPPYDYFCRRCALKMFLRSDLARGSVKNNKLEQVLVEICAAGQTSVLCIYVRFV